MANLVTFGDSWPAGAELKSMEKPYGYLLAQKLGMSFYNYAVQATSNDHMLLQLNQFIKDHPSKIEGSTAVFFITSPTRSLFIDDDNIPKEIMPWADKEQGERNYYHFKYFHSTHQEHFRLNSSILSLQRVCEQCKINDYYIVGWSDCTFDFFGIDTNKIYNKTCAELFGVPGEKEFTLAEHSEYVKPNMCHPNQLGHELIANTLAEWINNEQNN